MLAGTVRSPGSVSLRTLSMLRDMTSIEAKTFKEAIVQPMMSARERYHAKRRFLENRRRLWQAQLRMLARFVLKCMLTAMFRDRWI